MECELVDIDIEGRKLRLNCEGVDKTFDLEEEDCKILQQGKNPPETIMVKCD